MPKRNYKLEREKKKKIKKKRHQNIEFYKTNSSYLHIILRVKKVRIAKIHTEYE